jgi:hypothetical protein
MEVDKADDASNDIAQMAVYNSVAAKSKVTLSLTNNM